jgi:two-component system sensor histidine kinase/response regulator
MDFKARLSDWRPVFGGELMSDRWVARLLRTAGTLAVIVTIGSVVDDYVSGHGFGTWNTVSDVTTMALGASIVLLARWLAPRSWKPLLFTILVVIMTNYSIAAISTREVGEVFTTLLLFEMGSGALIPWETGWQGALSMFGMAAWFVTTRFVPDRPGFEIDSWITLTAGTVIGVLSCHLRRRFEQDRSAAQQRIRESEIRLRRILEASPEAILIIREKDLMLRQMLGFGVDPADQKALVGTPITEQEFFRSDPKQQQFIRDVMSKGEMHDIELNFKPGPDDAVPVLASAVRAEIDDEPSIVCYIRNIVELKRVQRRLEESDRRFRGIFAAMPGSAAIFEIDGTLIDINRPITRTGFKRSEIIGRSLDDLGFWADPAERDEFERRMLRHGRVDSMEVRVGLRSGGSAHSLISASPLEIDGKVRIVAIAQDIEELKQAQRRAQESQARFQRMFNASTDSMLLTDFPGGTVIDVNEEFTRLTGYPREEVVGHDLRTLGLWSDRNKAGEFADALERTGEVRNIEDAIRTRSGSRVQCLMSGTLMEVEGRRCCLAITRDITALKKIQEQLIAASEAALEASRAKSEFLSSMSHEIRTPMNAILGMTDLLSETDPTPEQHKYLEVMAANGRTLEELINSILDLAKIESGKLEIEQAPFDLVPALEKIVTGFGYRAHARGLELTLRIAPDVPQHLVGDSLRLGQILINLIGNAIKFTELGEVAVVVEKEYSGDGAVRLRFSVSDTGIGIAPDKLEKIFLSFTQADSSTTRKYGGTGLGLSIAHRLVGLMGGSIRAESEPEHGSTFIFTARFGLASGAAASPPLPDLRERRVLVVDDNATSRQVVAEIVAALGAEVVKAGSGEEALVLVREARSSNHPFSLVVLDVWMPDINGLEVATRLHAEANSPEPTVLMVSPGNLKSQLVRLRQAGLGSYLVKPATRSSLYEAIASATEKRPAAETLAPRAAQPAVLEGLPPAHLLIVEDTPANRFLISAYLRNTPFKLEFAANGQIALEKFMHHQYDLVLMDIQMPVMDGYSATRAIRVWENANGRRHTPVVALTAAALDEEIARTREAGCDAHLTKPIKKATLVALIGDYLARRDNLRDSPAPSS